MALLVLGALALISLCLAERTGHRLAFSVAAFATLVVGLLQLTGDGERAMLLATLLAVAIIGFSEIKLHHSGRKLRAADLALTFAGTLRFLITQYAAAAAVTIGGGLLLAVAALGVIWRGEGAQIPAEIRLGLLAAASSATGLLWFAYGGARAFRETESEASGFFQTFAASVIDWRAWVPARGLTMVDLAAGPQNAPLPLRPAIPARRELKPDILVIQHESVFDPRLYGLPVEPAIAEFLAPRGGINGTLNVDIFGGGSWQSEFSLLTGLSSASFGPDAYFIFRKGAGRFHHALPLSLRALGYRSTLVSSCRRSFLNYARFYESIGVDEALFADDVASPLDAEAFEATHSDTLFFDALRQVMVQGSTHRDRPRFVYALTNFNHGPHDRRLVAPGAFESERGFARESCPDPLYGEYYARLAETAASWRLLRARLQERARQRPTVIVHYGDHQPVMARRLERALGLPADARRPFRTFFAIEGLNCALDRETVRVPEVLDVAFLGTLALGAAGLPLDRILATRASLIPVCGSGYFHAATSEKQRFHRTLVDLGLIDLGSPGKAGQIESPAPVAPTLAAPSVTTRADRKVG